MNPVASVLYYSPKSRLLTYLESTTQTIESIPTTDIAHARKIVSEAGHRLLIGVCQQYNL